MVMGDIPFFLGRTSKDALATGDAAADDHGL
jgi:hypothetical protein